MNTNLKNDENHLFKLAVKGLRFFLLTLLGFAIALVVSKVLGISTIVEILLSASLWQWVFRIAVCLFCLFAIAMMIESWR
ncbi:hypothetical protein WKK05_24430 [Nostoc sp. UHCC 0302]|uniref:hypothetical protein n=1 Tax=Nostoc sp. UHCC 0302 TaxID=3134896 RepID=UPI00311C9E5F